MHRPVERIPASVIDTLSTYDWPGNVRELENVIERALIISQGPVLRLNGIFMPIAPAGTANATPPAAQTFASKGTDRSLRGVEHDEILRVCEACRWKIKGRGAAAERLGLNPSTLYFRMKKLGIARPYVAPI